MKNKFTEKLYMGIVEENYDPNRKGRIKVRVQSLYNDIEVEQIPYASPFMDLAGKEFKVPAIGKIVNVLFLTNDLYEPYYIFSENHNINLENKLGELTNEEYVDFVALLFDERTQISADSEELTIDHLYNKITINKESINHELKDNTQKLNLGDRGATQEAVLGTRFFDWLDDFMKELMKPTSLLADQGNIPSQPVTKVKLTTLINKYFMIRDTFVSNNVKIVDNNEVTKLERDPETDTAKNDKSLIDNTATTDSNNNNLQDSIQSQNNKSCANEQESKPTSQLPQPEIEADENNLDFLPIEKTFETRLIDNKVVPITDSNRTKVDNYEKTSKANTILDNISPNGDYKGQDYYIDGQQTQKNKVYNTQEIENLNVDIPDTSGDYSIYLSGDNVATKSGVIFKKKIIIEEYYPPFIKMVNAAKTEGVTIILNDSFRKYEEQLKIRVKNAPYRKKNDDTFLKTASSTKFRPYTGRPGWSRHHYGIAFDISTAGGKNKAYKWLEKNALLFGFVRTVKSETWHWEYKPWEVIDMPSWDKYGRVPKNHHTWNDDTDDDIFSNSNDKNNTKKGSTTQC
jgi:LAS superfamily LD-carboxypeptidase LdcB